MFVTGSGDDKCSHGLQLSHLRLNFLRMVVEFNLYNFLVASVTKFAWKTTQPHKRNQFHHPLRCLKAAVTISFKMETRI